MPRTRALWGAALLALTLTACRDTAAPPQASRPAAPAAPTPLEFNVDGRSNDAPSIAAFGQTVTAVWTASTDAGSDVFASVSLDGGVTFNAPVRVNDVAGDARASGEQPARVAVGKVIHVAWPSRHDGHSVIRYSRSTDGGRSFSPAVSIAGDASSGARGWESITLGYDGGVHVVWLDGQNATPTAAHHNQGAAGAKSAGSMDAAPRQDVFHALWKGDDARQVEPIATNVCFCCKTAVVTSGDRVYAAWRHIYPGSLRDIAFAKSTDNGRTFGEPVRVSEDGWKIDGCPDDGPAMATDGHGGVHIVWPTLVAGDTPSKGIFYASLRDEKAFTPRVRLDAGDSQAAHPQITANHHTTTAVVWDEHAAGTRRIVFRLVKDDVAAEPQYFSGNGLSYPVVAAGEGYWIVLWSAQAAGGKSVIEGRRIPDVSLP